MMHIIARGGLLGALIPGMDHQDHPQFTLVGKATWSFANGALKPVEQKAQIPIHHAPEYLGEPGLSSLRWVGDGAPAGAGTDIAVLGEAVAERPLAMRDAAVEAGGRRVDLRLHGPRCWDRGLFGWRMTPAEPATRFALGWEQAVGGIDRKGRRAPRNPIGLGWADPVHGAALPGIDDPRHPYTSAGSRPEAVGTGFVDPAWQPRLAFAGTYDDAWLKRRSPLLPLDFDPRFHRAAAGPLALPTPLAPGSAMRLIGLTAMGDDSFTLPKGGPRAIVRLRGTDQPLAMTLDTVAVLPAEGLVTVTWKATVTAEAIDCEIAWILWDGEQP